MTVRSDRRFVLAILAVWLFASVILIVTSANAIAHARYPDPDDILRLQEVRDFLAGQSWFDVTQYRINPPGGVPMHWSRLVDLPIAGVMLLLKPFFGAPRAEMAAAVVVPLMTLGTVMALAAVIAKRLLGPKAAIFAALLIPTSPAVLQQIRPMRVDHHGWQIALALGALLATCDGRPKRSGVAGGLLLALWLQISLEGLPFSVAVSALFAIRWLFAPETETVRFRAFITTLAAASLLLFAGTHAAPAWSAVHCDAISPLHLATLGLAAGGCVLATIPAFARAFISRVAALGATAIATAATYHLIAPQCGLNAFGELDPLIRTIWYDHVLEGLPLWRQSPDLMVSAIGFPLIGLMGAWFGWRQADAGTRPLWLNYAALLAAAALVTILVQRAGAVANALAVIGTVALLMPLLQRTQASANILVRVLGTAFAILALAPPTLALTYVGFAGNGQKGGEVKDRACSTTENYRLLNALPPSRLMTNIDIGPGVLHETRSTIVASGHHRNQMGIKDTMLTFIRGDEAARAILLKHRIDYIVVCPDMVEMDVYSGYGPDGLWSHLRKGKTPPWLKPASIPHNPGFAIWKVEP